MLIKFLDASTGSGYDPYPDFKAMVEKLCVNGAEVFFAKAGSDISRIYAFGKGCCMGEIPVAIQTGLMIDSATAQSDFATDFPTATQIDHNSGGASPTIEV